MSVRIVVVSHSAALADGVVELAGQMAPDVELIAAGGGDDGGLGTSFDRIVAALADPPADGVVVLYDLGSALLTTETALEFSEDAERIEIVDAPLVEGALAAATTAQGGADRAAVAAAARAAGGGGGGPAAPAVAPTGVPDSERVVTVPNRLGLHARPAAELAGTLAGVDAHVSVGRPDGPHADVRSVLDVVGLRLRGGDEVAVRGHGPAATSAVDRVASLIAGGFGETDEAVPAAAGPPPGGPQPGAAGRALGPLVHAGTVSVPEAAGAGVEVERDRLGEAISSAQARLNTGDELARMHAVLVADPALRADADRGIDDGQRAESAWWAAVQRAAQSFADQDDEFLAARAVDVRDAGAAVLTALGFATDRIPAEVAGTILATDEIGPGELGEFAARGGAGVVLAGGSPTAHAVVVARGLGLPLVLRAGDRLDAVADGTVVAIDGSAGSVTVDPPDADRLRAQIAADAEAAAAARGRAAAPVEVAGRRVLVAANVGSIAEARAAVTNGADAVGLLRTELLLLDGAELPDEQAQADDLAAIFAALGDRPVVVRVLDAGGDKPVRALQLDPQRNGFLGVRGLRWLLQHPAVLRTQLRAIARAAAGHDVAVMAPMVSVAAEAEAFRAAVREAVASLEAEGVPHGRLDRIGVMVEVPAAALTVDTLAPHVDFVSVGTNDLTSYTMAADRTEPGVADLLDPHATAVWRLIEQLCAAAGAAGVEVAVCGELAAVPELADRFVALGVRELSMAPAAIPRVKAHLREG